MQYRRRVIAVLLTAFLNIAVYAKNLLLIPILARELGVHKYGVWINIQTIIDLLVPFCLFDLHTAAKRFLAAEKDVAEIRRGFWSALQFGLLSSWTIGLLFWVLCPFLVALIFSGESANLDEITAALRWAFAFLGASVIAKSCICYFQTVQRHEAYTALVMVEAVTYLGTAFVLTQLGWGLWSPIIGFFGTQVLVAVVGLTAIMRRIGFALLDRDVLRVYLPFSMPLALFGVLYWVIQLSDRYMIAYFLGLEDVGRYAVNYSLGSVITFIFSPFFAFLLPMATEMWERGDREELRAYFWKVIKYPLLIALPAFVTFTFFADRLVEWLAGREYVETPALSALVMAGYIVLLASTIFSALLQIVKDTKAILWINVGAAPLNIALNIVFIPKIGKEGAALATALTFGIQTCVYGVWASRYFSFDLGGADLPKMIVCTAATGAVVFVTAGEYGWPLGYALTLAMAIYVGLIAAWRVVTKWEVEIVWQSIAGYVSGWVARLNG